jgi:hypothetical protein
MIGKSSGKKTRILFATQFIRARLRGVDYEYGFEIVLNKEPALKKVLIR